MTPSAQSATCYRKTGSSICDKAYSLQQHAATLGLIAIATGEESDIRKADAKKAESIAHLCSCELTLFPPHVRERLVEEYHSLSGAEVEVRP